MPLDQSGLIKTAPISKTSSQIWSTSRPPSSVLVNTQTVSWSKDLQTDRNKHLLHSDTTVSKPVTRYTRWQWRDTWPHVWTASEAIPRSTRAVVAPYLVPSSTVLVVLCSSIPWCCKSMVCRSSARFFYWALEQDVFCVIYVAVIASGVLCVQDSLYGPGRIRILRGQWEAEPICDRTVIPVVHRCPQGIHERSIYGQTQAKRARHVLEILRILLPRRETKKKLVHTPAIIIKRADILFDTPVIYNRIWFAAWSFAAVVRLCYALQCYFIDVRTDVGSTLWVNLDPQSLSFQQYPYLKTYEQTKLTIGNSSFYPRDIWVLGWINDESRWT